MSSLIKETAISALKGFAVAGGATVGIFVAIEAVDNMKQRKKTPQFYRSRWDPKRFRKGH